MESKSVYIAFITVFLLATTFSGCKRPNTSDLQDELQPICHDNDAVILRSSFDVSGGEIIYLKKEKSQWNLCQSIDLRPYMRGCHIIHKDDWERNDNQLATRSFAYNEKWLVILIIRPGLKFIGTKSRRIVLIFKRHGSQWQFYKRFSPSDHELDGMQIAVSHDSLFVQVCRVNNGKYHINLCCFDLRDSKLPLKQELAPSWSVREQDMISNPKFFIHDDQMLVSWRRRLSEEEELKYFGKLSYDGEYTEELVLYRWNGSQWKQVQNLSKLYPEDALLKCYGKPIDDIQKVDWGQNELYVLTACYGSVWKFVKNENQRWDFAERVIGNPTNEKTGLKTLIDGEIGYQTPLSYNVLWRDKERRVGIVKPSSDGKTRVVEPDWLFDDADPVTSEKMCSYYKTIGRPYFDGHGIIIERAGEKSFYELTDYIPKIDHSLCNQTLVTTYMFDECYFEYSPLQQAEVWAGVNVYEIDPVEGPKRVFALTTRNAEELKVAPIDNPEPANLQFPSRETPLE